MEKSNPKKQLLFQKRKDKEQEFRKFPAERVFSEVQIHLEKAKPLQKQRHQVQKQDSLKHNLIRNPQNSLLVLSSKNNSKKLMFEGHPGNHSEMTIKTHKSSLKSQKGKKKSSFPYY